MTSPPVRSRAWALFDAVVARAADPEHTNPWRESAGRLTYVPDYRTLQRLLGIPLQLGATSQSGVPALALDVWTSYELRRAGFGQDAVWPRPQPPRILPSTVVAMRAGASARQRAVLDEMLGSGKTFGGETGSSANLLGRNYVKQVDVVMSSWATGPELMISTKRMDSSFGKNAANRVEESYGDAKNLRNRHPQAALGFVYGLRSTAFDRAPRTAEWILDLLDKLGRADDAYDGVALVVPQWSDFAGPAPDDGEPIDPLGAADIGPDGTGDDQQLPAALSADELEARLATLPEVSVRTDLVPEELSPERFFATMVNRVLDACPVTFHEGARWRKRHPAAG